MKTSKLVQRETFFWKRRLSTHSWVPIGVAVIALLFVALRITPSSYGVALAALGSPGAGLVAGQAKPIRSDEWAVITPAVQATINNGFDRYNATSFYHEDLRQIYAMPVHDWGFLFRPTMWLFGVARPSLAFAFHHVLVQTLCIVGFALLFRRSGLVGINAWLLSSCIFWSGFVQYFWTTVGPVVAWWPWVTLAIIHVRRSWWALPVVAYVFACWALSFFYPPLLITLSFVTACIVLGMRHNRLPPVRLIACGVACIIGAAIAVFYLRDTLLALNDTFYPGQRRAGGGGLLLEKLVSMFVPYAFIFKAEPYGVRSALAEINICEFGVVGSVYFFFALLLVSPRRVALPIFKARRVEAAILFGGLAATFAWMTVELPSIVGAPLLWDRVPPPRMVMAAGVLLALASVYVLRHISVRLTLPRATVGVAVIVAFAIFKSSHGLVSFRLINRDLVPALGLVVVFLLRGRMSKSAEHTSLLGVAALTNFLCFASFNPLQQADPIFATPQTEKTRAFAESARRQHGRPLVEPFPGRVLNGLGYSSIAHVEATPQMRLWRDLLPEVPEETLQSTFNRYAHIILSDEDVLTSPQPDVALLPKRMIMPRATWSRDCKVAVASPASYSREVERLENGNVQVVLRGNVPAAGVFRDQVFHVVTEQRVEVHAHVAPEPGDVVDSGHDEHAFEITFEMTANAHADQVCVLFEDLREGELIALDDPSSVDECGRCVAR